MRFLELFTLKILADYTDFADLKYSIKSASSAKSACDHILNLTIQFFSAFFSIQNSLLQNFFEIIFFKGFQCGFGCSAF